MSCLPCCDAKLSMVRSCRVLNRFLLANLSDDLENIWSLRMVATLDGLSRKLGIKGEERSLERTTSANAAINDE